MLAVAHRAWASSTWAARTSLTRRFMRDAPPHQDLGAQMAMFVQQQTIAPSSKLTYAKTLLAVASLMGEEIPMLRTYVAGLRRMGAAHPLRQAKPITREHLLLLVRAQQCPFLRAAIWLAWKTASRWSDVLGLTRACFVQLTQEQIVVEWQTTKTTSPSDFRAWRWTVVHDDQPMDWFVSTVKRLRGLQCLVTTPTDRLVVLMRQSFPAMEYTAHSIKRGAIDLLVRASAEGRLQPTLIPLLAKHSDPSTQFPSTTLRYAADKVSMALMLGTQHATRLL